jgi:hypothetical protein
MSAKIRIWWKPGNEVEVVNAGRERVSVRGPEWADFVEIRPNSRFTGTKANGRHEELPPAAAAPAGPVECPLSVRRATEADIDELFLLVPRLLQETSLLPVSSMKILNLVERCCTRQGGAIAGIVYGPDGIDGTIGLDVAESEVSDHRYVRAIWLGLHPDLAENPPKQGDPRGQIGRRLFEFARWYHNHLEEEAGHPVLMQFDVTTRVSLGRKVGLYERNATPVGATFAYVSRGQFLTPGIVEAA